MNDLEILVDALCGNEPLPVWGGDKYVEWMTEHYPTAESAYGQCQKAVQGMILAFPELREAKGHALTAWGRRQHFWCLTEDGEVVDPTAIQYPTGVWEYEEATEETLVRVGPCVYCGVDIMMPLKDARQSQKMTCSDQCYTDFVKSLG